MKNVLIWIVLIAALVALPAWAIWAIMSMHPGMGIGQAIVVALGIGVPIFFQLMVVHLVRAFKRR